MIHHNTDREPRGCYGAVLLAVTLWAIVVTVLLVVNSCVQAPPSVSPVRESGVKEQ